MLYFFNIYRSIKAEGEHNLVNTFFLLIIIYRSSEALMTSEDDFELMEIPLSPTNYEQPSTPDHEPPSALEAEKAIMEVLNNLRNVSYTYTVLHIHSTNFKEKKLYVYSYHNYFVFAFSRKLMHSLIFKSNFWGV